MATAALKQQIIGQLKGFDKESHAKSLATGILRSCKDAKQLTSRISQANDMVAVLRTAGVTSFFAAEYPKVFPDANDALSTRSRLIVDFQMEFSLPEKRAAKMADCIVFSAAKRQERDGVGRLANIASAAMEAGVPFDVVADVVYYNPPDVSPQKFANRCLATSLGKGVVLSVSELELAAGLSGAV